MGNKLVKTSVECSIANHFKYDPADDEDDNEVQMDIDESEPKAPSPPSHVICKGHSIFRADEYDLYPPSDVVPRVLSPPRHVTYLFSSLLNN